MRRITVFLFVIFIGVLVGCEDSATDTTPPVAILIGEETVYLEYMDTYEELGAICEDDIDENCKVFINGDVVNTTRPGTYIISYFVVDESSNTGIVIDRTVIVSETTSPIISLIGDDIIYINYGDSYNELGANCTDNYDTTCVVIIDDSNVDETTIGTYSVLYNTTDTEGNVALEIIREVVVSDNESPIISLIGDPVIELEYNSIYSELGATCTDNYDLTCDVLIGDTVIDTSILGSTVITYNAVDASSNDAIELTRTVIVQDTTAPVITLNGDSAINLDLNASYSELGATCTDNYDTSCTVIISGDTVDTSTVGTYHVTYNITDTEGNIALEVIRTVTINDTVSPITSLIGDSEVDIEYGTTYNDLGINCTDNFDTTCVVVMGGDTVNVYTLGTYVITYNVTDSAGNIAIEVSRTVTVEDTTSPVIDVSELRTTVTLDGSFDFTSSFCADNRDLTCTVEVVTVLDTSVLTTQLITLRAVDTEGNETTVVHQIEVIEGLDTTIYVPAGYYDTTIGLTGAALKDSLYDIIKNHTEYSYTSSSTDVWDILREADEDPNNSDNVMMFYSGFSWPKECQDTVTANLPDYCFDNNDRTASYTEWNREHIWSKSRGDFGTSRGAGTDAHHLVAAERTMNSTKNNRMFEDCNDGDDTNIVDRGFGNYTCNTWDFEPRDEVKGDVARMIFYMATRYESEDSLDLYVLDDADSDKSLKLSQYGDLDDLLRWHIEDPVDEWELERNQVVYTYQANRNPFIDHPELVELIWGTPESVIEYEPS